MASVACWALLLTSYSVSIKAQDLTTGSIIDQTTGNLITNTWSGAPSSTTSPGGYSGGYQPTYNTSTNTIQFGYNQGTASQTIAVNTALANAGTGIQVTGFNYGWKYYNQDMNRGTLTGNIGFTSATGSPLVNYTYSMPRTTQGWTDMSGVQMFTSPYAATGMGNMTVSFTGKDDRWWAGYYGPMVKDVDVRLRYGVDPCATNPAYGPQCAGFDKVVESANLVPNPEGYTYGGGWVLTIASLLTKR